MIKVMLFDVDGVLANGEPFSEHLARDYGITREVTDSFFSDRFLECLVGKADLKQELAIHLHQWGWNDSVEDFLSYWFCCEHTIDEPLIQVVQRLRQHGVECYIATNQEKYRTAYILEQMGFADSFDGIFSSAYVGYMKHHAEFFVHVLNNLLHVKPDEILFWDDSSGNVEIARTIGLRAEVYDTFADFQQKVSFYMGTF